MSARFAISLAAATAGAIALMLLLVSEPQAAATHATVYFNQKLLQTIRANP
jgi:hypothetical protein